MVPTGIRDAFQRWMRGGVGDSGGVKGRAGLPLGHAGARSQELARLRRCCAGGGQAIVDTLMSLVSVLLQKPLISGPCWPPRHPVPASGLQPRTETNTWWTGSPMGQE